MVISSTFATVESSRAIYGERYFVGRYEHHLRRVTGPCGLTKLRCQRREAAVKGGGTLIVFLASCAPACGLPSMAPQGQASGGDQLKSKGPTVRCAEDFLGQSHQGVSRHNASVG